MPATAPLIKGFLPIRLKLSKDDETFFYVKEHQTGKSDSGAKNGCTMFVVNAPIIPGVSTKLALRSLLGRYADVSRVTVVPNPRGGRSSEEEFLTVDSLALWSPKITMPTFLPPIPHEGKYAHVVFATPKGLKKTMQELHQIMSESTGKKKSKKQKKKSSSDAENDSDDDGDVQSLPGLTMDRLEIQTLADETAVQHEENERKRLGKDPLENGYNNDNEDFEEYDDEGKKKSKSKSKKKKEAAQGALAVMRRYQESSQALSRKELLAECNRVMAEYEKAEEAKRKAHKQAKDGNMVDDDGFVTVSYSSNTATGTEVSGIHSMLEESITTTTTSHSRRSAAPRRRNNNNNKKKGSSELQDFYRFQRKEHKKRSLDQLRTQFEEDLKRIKKMKEDHKYRPF